MWAKFDPDILTHPKWKLSDAAFKLAVLLCVWSSKHSPTGFVTDAVVLDFCHGSRRRLNRLVKELIETGRGIHEFGILEATEGGWFVHDFEDYAPPKKQEATVTATDRSEAARRAGLASAEARRARNGSAQPRPMQNKNGGNGAERRSNGSPNGRSNGSRTDVRTLDLDLEESSTTTTTAKDLSGSARKVVEVVPASPEIQSIPADLSLTEGQMRGLRDAGMQDAEILAGVAHFRANHADGSERRALPQWRRWMYSTVLGSWQSAQQRANGPGPAKAERKPELTRYTRSDGTVVWGSSD